MGLTTALKFSMAEPSSSPPIDLRLLNDGDIVGNWKVLALVGIGGNGEVYRVKHVKSGEIGALKTPHSDDSHQRQRFDLESEILRTFNVWLTKGRQHFPRLFDEGTIPNSSRPYLVIEYLKELNLPRPPNPRLKDSAVAKIILKVCKATRELHRKGYLHRDIKPENLMQRENGEIVLIDFGLSIRIKDVENPLANRVSVTQGQVRGVGTEGAMAPEQAFGHASVRSDIYGLGALAEECFWGNPPSRWIPIIQKAESSNTEFRYHDIEELESAIRKCKRLSILDQIKTFIKKCLLLIILSIAVGYLVFKLLIDHNPLTSEHVKGNQPLATGARKQRPVLRQKIEAKDFVAENARTKHMEKAEADQIARFAAESESERDQKNDKRLFEETKHKAIDLFKNGDWQAGLKQANLADHNDAELQFWLGTCYDLGLGTNHDAPKAVAYFRQAAERGQIDAQCELGRHYESGLGVAKDLLLAKRWYQAAASQGSSVAETNLRRLYNQGHPTSPGTTMTQPLTLGKHQQQEASDRIARESDKLTQIREDVAKLKNSIKRNRDESTRTVVQSSGKQPRPTSDRTREKFDGAATLSLLKFSSSTARNYYKKACNIAGKGAHNKEQVKAEYNKGRACGGPEWPELEAWLYWWE